MLNVSPKIRLGMLIDVMLDKKTCITSIQKRSCHRQTRVKILFCSLVNDIYIGLYSQVKLIESVINRIEVAMALEEERGLSSFET